MNSGIKIKLSKKPDKALNHTEFDTNSAEIPGTHLKNNPTIFLKPPLPSSSGFKSSVTLVPSFKYNDFPKRNYASSVGFVL